MNKTLEKIGVWLLDKGNTKQVLAKELGISTVTLNKRLSGETEWMWDEVCRLADLFKCPISDFRD